MRDRGGDVDGADGEGGAGWERSEVDVGELDDGEGAESERVFRVGYGGDEVCGGVEMLAVVLGLKLLGGKRMARVR